MPLTAEHCVCYRYSPLGSPDSSSMIGHNGASVLELPVVKALAAEYGKTAAQVLIRWGVQRGTSVLPKSVTPERIASNFDVPRARALKQCPTHSALNCH